MGEGLKADKARDATFLLTGAGTWVGKATYLTTDLMTIQEGKRAIAQAVSDNSVKVRGLGHPCANLLAQQPFQFNTHTASPLKIAVLTTPKHPVIPLEAKNTIGEGETKGPNSLGFLSPSMDHGFKSDGSSLSTTSSMSSRSDRLDRSRCSRQGR